MDQTPPGPGRVTDGPTPRLETPTVRFGRLPDGCSVARPIVVSWPAAGPSDLDVVVPPLAPFSITRPPCGGGRSAEVETGPGDGTRREVWVRYDATHPMARDRGELVIASPSTGHRWRVELSGAGELAGRWS